MPEQVLTPLSSAAPALAVEINVLSGAAVEPGLIAAADVFRQRTGNNVKITFATTPDIRRLLALAQHLMSWCGPRRACKIRNSRRQRAGVAWPGRRRGGDP